MRFPYKFPHIPSNKTHLVCLEGNSCSLNITLKATYQLCGKVYDTFNIMSRPSYLCKATKCLRSKSWSGQSFWLSETLPDREAKKVEETTTTNRTAHKPKTFFLLLHFRTNYDHYQLFMVGSYCTFSVGNAGVGIWYVAGSFLEVDGRDCFHFQPP